MTDTTKENYPVEQKEKESEQEEETQHDTQTVPYRDDSKFGNIYLNDRQCQLTYIDGIGHILARNLEREVTLMEAFVTETTRDIIMANIPLRYGLMEQIEDLSSELKGHSKYVTLVSTQNALTAIQFMGQYRKDSRGFKKFGDWGGIANLKWISGSIMTPFIYLDRSIYIPLITTAKMPLPGVEGLPTVRLTGWDKVKMQIEIVKLSNEELDSTSQSDIMAVQLDKLKETTNTTIQFREVPY